MKNKTKKFKSDEPEIPFTFDFYLIYWEDIQSDFCMSIIYII